MTIETAKQEQDRTGGWRSNPWTSLLVLALGFFVTMLDTSIVNIAIPDIIKDLDASLADVLWAVNAYVLVVAVLLITAGRLGDLYGARRLFLAGLVIFTLFSLVCGIARNPGELIAARALQGLGAALLLPQTMAMIVTLFPPARRGLAMGIWGAVGGVAAIAGPSLGGLLVSSLGWRWIFFVNVPVGAAAVLLTLLAVPDVRHDRRHRLDLGGISLASAALLCLVFPLMEGERFGWNGWMIALLAAAVVFGTAFLLHERGRQDREPLVPFGLFRDGDYTAMTVVGGSVAFSIIALMLLLTLFFQTVLGFDALKAGLALAPPALLSTVIAPFAGRSSDRFDGRHLLLAGLLLTAAGMGWAAAIMDTDATWFAFLPPMIVIGLGNGLLIAPMNTVAMRNVPPNLAGAASGMLSTVRQMGPVTAIALVGLVLQQAPDWSVDRAATQAYVDSVRTGMALPIGMILLGVAVCLFSGRRTAEERHA